MMMFDDALEPEFEDLGAEFAAQCAAENTYAQLDQPQQHQIPNDAPFSANMQDNTHYQSNSSYGYDMPMDNINQHEMMNQVHHVEEVATSSNQGNHIYQQENIHAPHTGNTYSQEMTGNYIQQDSMQHPTSSFESYNSQNIYQQENVTHQVSRPAANQYYQLPYGSEGQVMMQAPQRTVTIDQQGRRMIVQRQPVYQQQNIQTSQGIYNQSLQHQSMQREVQQRQPSVLYVRRVPGSNGATSQQVYIQTPQGLVPRPQPVRVVRTVNQNGQPITVIQRRIQRPIISSDGHQETSQSQNCNIVRMGERTEIAPRVIPNSGALNGSNQFSQRADRPVPVSQPSGSTMNAPLYHPHQKIVQYRPVNSANTPQHHTVFKQNSVVQSIPENINYTDASQLPVSYQTKSCENVGHSSSDASQYSMSCNSEPTSASSSSTSIGSIIPTVRPPVPPIPRKKKPEPPVVAATDIAQAAAMQRIGTEEGWKQMNTWLKSAGSDEKTAQIKDLLKQCLQAKVSVDLLLSNDTPKFVRQLSKTHNDTEVKKLASQCVVKWKKEVANPEVPSVKKEKKSKDPQPDILDDEDMDSSSASPRKDESSFENSLSREEKTKESKRSEKRKSGDNVENNESEKGEKRNKAKAKVYTAKSRLTGLESNVDEQPAVKKAKKDDEKPVSPDEKAKKDESDLSGKLPPLPKIPKKIKPVVPTTPQKVTLSTGFMDALAVSKEPKKKVPVKKRTIDKKKDEPLPPAPLSVLDGLFAEQAKQVEIGGPKTFLESTASNSPAMPKAPSPVNEEDDSEMIPQSRRKIRFADEFGKDLVMIKEFEIEEGERINVNHMSPEDMKHHEMLMERRHKEENTDIDDEEDKKEELTWRLLHLTGSHVSDVRGSESQAKLMELERQKTAMRAFNDPSRPTTVFAEPDDFDPLAARRHVPPIIPLEPVDVFDENSSNCVASEAAVKEDVPLSEPEKASPALNVSSLPSSLQNLLDGLKKQGIVGGGQATSVVPNVSSLVSSLSTATLATINNKLPSTMTVSSADRPQQTYQQIPLNGPVITGNNTYQQQMLPPVIHQVHPSTSSNQGHYEADDSGHDIHRPFNGPRPMGRFCQFYNTPRGCNFGDNCKFIHDDRAQPTGHQRGFHRDRDNRGARGDWDRRGGGDWEGSRDRERDYDHREPDRRDQRRDWAERDFRGRGRGRGGFRGGRYDDRPPFRSYRGGDRREHRDAREFGRSPNDYGSGADEIQSPMQSPADYIQSPNDKSSTGSAALVIPSERLPSTNSPASPQQE